MRWDPYAQKWQEAVFRSATESGGNEEGWEAFEERLAQTREKGFAVSLDEVDLGASVVAVPILAVSGVTNSLGIIAPAQRFTADKVERLAALTAEAAARLGRSFGAP
jgi:DNA-binding IclR family transcriptional regulator